MALRPGTQARWELGACSLHLAKWGLGGSRLVVKYSAELHLACPSPAQPISQQQGQQGPEFCLKGGSPGSPAHLLAD